MDSGRVGDTALTVFAAGEDEGARRDRVQLAQEIGFDAVARARRVASDGVSFTVLHLKRRF